MATPRAVGYLACAAVVLASAPALIFIILGVSLDLTGRDLVGAPELIGLSFFVLGALAPFVTPVALIVTVIITPFKAMPLRLKIFCWLFTLGAIAATLFILGTFTRPAV